MPTMRHMEQRTNLGAVLCTPSILASRCRLLVLCGTLVLLFLVDKTIGLRVSAEDENMGLDLSQHNEEGYDLNT